jgi:nucleotidyltransferase substrate binding protein (TIGR01987 family)
VLQIVCAWRVARAAHPGDEFIRDSVVQRFELTFELAHVLLKRYLEATSASAEEIDAMSFPMLIRTGSERGLLRSAWDRWFDFRKARNSTSHAYDESRLPFKAEFQRLDGMSKEFRRRVEKDFVLVQAER